jgi:YHS domain-containing protein
MRKIITYTCLLAWIGCASPATDEKQSKRAPIEDVNTRPAISESQLASKKDPVCGMPAYKFLKDTTFFENKIYGFCGKGCKEAFFKNPKKYSH